MSVAQSYITFGGQTCDKEAAIQHTFNLDNKNKQLTKNWYLCKVILFFTSTTFVAVTSYALCKLMNT